MITLEFEWNDNKAAENIKKHKVSFENAKEIFADPDIAYVKDEKHSFVEERFFAVGKDFEGKVIIVRCTIRGDTIRIFGAAKWRKWRKYYEKRKNPGSLQDEEG